MFLDLFYLKRITKTSLCSTVKRNQLIFGLWHHKQNLLRNLLTHVLLSQLDDILVFLTFLKFPVVELLGIFVVIDLIDYNSQNGFIG